MPFSQATRAYPKKPFPITLCRCVRSLLASPHLCRFPAGYPSKSLSVLIREGPKGSKNSLPAGQAKILQEQLQATAIDCAERGEVAVFTLASDASDWLQQYIDDHPGEGQVCRAAFCTIASSMLTDCERLQECCKSVPLHVASTALSLHW